MKSRLATRLGAMRWRAAVRSPVVCICIRIEDLNFSPEIRCYAGPLRHGRLHGSRRGRRGQRRHGASFLLQKNVLDRRRWDTREELRIAIVTWIERTYHRRRHERRWAG